MATSATINLVPTSVSTASPGLAHTNRTTAWDVIEHLMDYLGMDVTKAVPRVVRRAIQSALRELAHRRRWTYYYKHGRIQLRGPYSTGTVTYDHTGGANERQLTLAGGTWPAWAASGAVRIGNVVYTVDRRVSDTVLTLDATLNPGGDITTATAFTLFQDTYELPEDCAGTDEGYTELHFGPVQYVQPTEWLRVVRYYQSSANTPRFYTYRGHPKLPNRLALSLFPFPDADRTMDFVYHRRPRAVTIDEYRVGTVSVDAGSGPTTTITGAGTEFTSSMIGSVIRLSADGIHLPTPFAGDNPFAVERNIYNVANAATLVVDDAIPASYTNVKYRISDPIDVEDGAMLDAYLRCAEMHASIQRNHKDRQQARVDFEKALALAKESDSRGFSRRVARADGHVYVQSMSYMPSGPDQ